jgi:pimeloyl-ACP methyl ester carboxylesterase
LPAARKPHPHPSNNALGRNGNARGRDTYRKAVKDRRTIMTKATKTNGGEAIRSFRVNIPQEALDDLRRRLLATKWPERETVSDNSQGVPLDLMQEVARYWATDYDWRRCEAKINSYPNFLTEIDGLDIHFIHARSKHENALPVIITHGWPGSVIEQLKLIEPLTNPTAHGGSSNDAFHVVIPSMPGFGFSGKPTETGWNDERIGRAWIELMKRLGYTRFVAQGGDTGSPITQAMAVQAPPELLGIHVSFASVIPPDVGAALLRGEPAPAGLSDEERRAFQQVADFQGTHAAYVLMNATRPQTLYGLTDSPVALAAWLIDHGDAYDQPASSVISALRGRTINGRSAGTLTRDDVLDDITLYWLTNTGVSAARFYWEYTRKTNLLIATGQVRIPTAVSSFPGEIMQFPRSWTERAYPNLIYLNAPERGGHYAAWEEPQLFAQELRASFPSLRQSA